MIDDTFPWIYGPFVEDNVIESCEVIESAGTGARSLDLRFDDGRRIDLSEDLVPELLRALGVCEIAALVNMPVEVRSVPAAGYAPVAEDVFVGPAMTGPGERRGIRQL